MRKVFIASVLLLLSIWSSSQAYAESEFSSEYVTTYNISPTGETSVKYDITLINNRSDIVATKYSLSLNHVAVSNVTGSDRKGPLKITQEYKDGVTVLNVELNEQVIGLNKKNNFQLSFKTESFTSLVGEIWNVNIPKVDKLESTNKYDVTVNVPTEFGPTIFVAPQVQEIENGKLKTYKFNKTQLLSNGITASYGRYQVLNFRLKYQLANESPFASVQEIALPSDINDRQKVYYQNISQAPIKVKKDRDGNVIASYKVRSGETLEIIVTGTARVMGKQIIPEFGAKIEDLPKELVKTYTRSQKYWEVNNDEISRIATSLKNPNLTISQNAQLAYQFVLSTLKYDFTNQNEPFVERKGAMEALSNPDKSACMEFTDLFIAITRAMGIPAREINGYAFADTNTNAPLSININGGDLLHAWPEFYDPEFGWVAIDPTWGATSGIDYFTKLDTNHLTLAIKGMDSESPLPAGAYRVVSEGNLIDIDFAGSNDSFDLETLSDLEQAQKFVRRPTLSIPQIILIAIGTFTALLLAYTILFRIKRRAEGSY